MTVNDVLSRLDGLKSIINELDTAEVVDNNVIIPAYTRDDLIDILDAYGDMLARLKVQTDWGDR